MVKHLLQQYEIASGQAINFAKYGIYFNKNIRGEYKSHISNILEVHNHLNHERYLGLPSLIGRNKKGCFFFYP
jgi:hypothetical protein